MPAPLQVVIDTNVLVAALRSQRGASYSLLNDIGGSRWKANISVPLIWEYEEIANREKAAIGADASEIENLLKNVAEKSNHVEVSFKWPMSTRDQDDEMVLELAVAARAEYIITFNKADFAGARQFGITIVTPGEFLAILRS